MRRRPDVVPARRGRWCEPVALAESEHRTVETTGDSRGRNCQMDRLDPAHAPTAARTRCAGGGQGAFAGGAPAGAFDPWRYRDDAERGRRRPGRLQGRGDRRRHRQDRQRQPRGQRQLPGGGHRAVDLRQEGHAARPARSTTSTTTSARCTSTGARTRSRPPRSTTRPPHRPDLPGQARRLLRRARTAADPARQPAR